MNNNENVLSISFLRTLFPTIITILLGAVSMLDISEAIKSVVGVVFLGTLLLLPTIDANKHLMFILCANELLNIGTTSLTMIFVALFSAKEFLLSLKKMRVSVGMFLGFAALLLTSIVAYMAIGAKDAMLTTLKHLFFMYFTFKFLNDNRSNLKDAYTEAFQCIACGLIYFTVISIAINGFPSLSERFTPSSDITINFYGIVCALVVVNLLYSVLVYKAKAGGNICLIIGCSIIGLLTQSRSFILSTLIGVILIFFAISINKKLTFLIVIVICLTVFMVIYASVPSIVDFVNAAFSRIVNPANGDISNGRYELWELTISEMIRNPLYFWLGAGDYTKVGAAFDDKIMVAHNMFLEIWVIYGIVGSLILLFIYVCFFKHYLFYERVGKFKMVTVIPLLVMLCSLFFSHHFIGRSMSIVFALSFLPITIGSPNN